MNITHKGDIVFNKKRLCITRNIAKKGFSGMRSSSPASSPLYLEIDVLRIPFLAILPNVSGNFKNDRQMELFKEFDFSALDDPDYKEDAVREDIVTPILKRLGYQPTGDNKMIRTKSLTHPFVYIGTKQHKVNIIPDYLLQVNSTYVFTLDAKAPNEDIKKGANVEQAFSYAIHPEIRTFFYGLCNGREICVYQWTKIDPILTIPIVNLDSRWEELYRLVSPLALTKPHLLNFLPDFGLSFLKMGADKNMDFHFVGAWVNFIAKIDDNTYTMTSAIGEESSAYLGSFDFTKNQYDLFISCVPDRVKDKIIKALSQQPYSIAFTEDDSFGLIVHAKFGETIHTNKNEQYLPLTVVNFDPFFDD